MLGKTDPYYTSSEARPTHLFLAVGSEEVNVLGVVRQGEGHHRVLVIAVLLDLPEGWIDRHEDEAHTSPKTSHLALLFSFVNLTLSSWQQVTNTNQLKTNTFVNQGCKS